MKKTEPLFTPLVTPVFSAAMIKVILAEQGIDPATLESWRTVRIVNNVLDATFNEWLDSILRMNGYQYCPIHGIEPLLKEA